MTDADARESTSVHWLLLGSLSSEPSGRRFVLDNESFAEAFTNAKLSARVDVGPALGAAGAHVVELGFGKLREYSLKHVLASLPVLADLRKLADDLSGPSSRRPADDAAVARVVQLIGDGPLAAEMRRVFAGEPEPEPAAVEAPTADAPANTNEALVDELLESRATKQADSKRAIDSFITAIRGKPKAEGSKATPAHRQARELIETAVFGAVGAVLNDPAVTEPEALWRGLKLVVDQAGSRSRMLVEIVDVAPAGIEAAMRECLDDEPMNRPDAFFCFDRLEDPARLSEIASTAEDLHAPVVAGVGPRFFGVDDFEAIVPALREAKPDAYATLPEGWPDLRVDEVSRWLAVTVNDVVVAAEGAGAAKRTVLGSSVFAFAAMVVASYRHTGGFARIMGKEGALEAPGLREIVSGREAGNAVPTAAFLSIRAQSELGAVGLVSLGSGRNSTAVMLSEMRTVRGSKDAVPFPAQVLTGRLVRFGRWVCDQVPAGSSREEVVTLFKQAATVFLFPGLTTGARLDAGVVDEGQGPAVRLVASVDPRLAGIPFEVGFDLPLSVALAD
ncbi:MAG: type VI secretion system contractile sheath large subunit [Myxococcales bacterium]|nr:type VI secretion system contractile sheath large subunit [Myxococcales bacterium]